MQNQKTPQEGEPLSQNAVSSKRENLMIRALLLAKAEKGHMGAWTSILA